MYSLEPGTRQDIVLPCDKDREIPPVYEVVSLSLRDAKALSMAYDKVFDLSDKENSGQVFEELVGVLSRVLVGWRNVLLGGEAIPFSEESIWDALTYQRAKDLVVECLAGNYLSEEDKKKFA